MGLNDEKQRKEDPHGRSLLPYKMAKVRLWLLQWRISASQGLPSSYCRYQIMKQARDCLVWFSHACAFQTDIARHL